MMNRLLKYSVILTCFCACERDEIPIQLPALDSSVRTTQLEMGDDYRYRLYYNIELDSVVAFHRKRDWDLGFECSATGNRIQLNSSKFMKAYALGQVDFNAVTSLGAAAPLQDDMGEFLEHTAIGEWQENDVYVIDRGIDADGQSYEAVKVQLISVSSSSFQIKHAQLDGSGEYTLEIMKNTDLNLRLYSFENQFIEEPPHDSWDLLFTQYSRFFDHYLGQDSLFYLVSGALLNPNGVSAASAFEMGLNDVETASEAMLLDYSTEEESIGWDWKEFDLNSGLYTIQPNLYVVKSMNGQYYRLRFNGFYSATGSKGAPLFDVKLLQ